MITAIELLKYNESQAYNHQNSDYRIKSMIEFAQLHVAEALEQASLTRRNGFYDSEKEEKEILNAYPLTNIK